MMIYLASSGVMWSIVFIQFLNLNLNLRSTVISLGSARYHTESNDGLWLPDFLLFLKRWHAFASSSTLSPHSLKTSGSDKLVVILHSLQMKTNAHQISPILWMRLYSYQPLLENQRRSWLFCLSQTSIHKIRASGKWHSVDDKATGTNVRVSTTVNPNSLVQLVMLANLSQQLVLIVAKQTEGQVAVDAVDWAIRVEQEETAQRSKRPNGSRVFQCRTGREDSTVHFDFY